MLGMTNLSLGVFTPEGKYLMKCAVCLETIDGTVSLAVLREAIQSCALRGGIQCPECRAKSCDRCGQAEGRKFWPGDGKVEPTNTKMLCTICRMEEMDTPFP